MSKIICEICGTVYPDNATMCPICGCPRAAGEEMELPADEALAAGAARTAQRVKGGRFSNKNVKKRNRAATAEAPRPSAKKPEKDPEEKKSNRGLVIAVVILLIAVILMAVYLFVTYFGGGGRADKPTETTAAATSASTDASTTAATDETGAACTDIDISGVDLAAGVDLEVGGRSWRMVVTAVPEDTVDALTYRSSDESVVTLSVEGGRVEIIPVGAGSATVTVSCGTVTKEFKVECQAPETTEATTETAEPTTETTEETTEPAESGKLSLSSEDFTLFTEGETARITPGKGISPAQCTWTSGDESVATVDNGKVTAVGPGYTKITVEFDGQKATCIVRCRWEEETQPGETTEATDPTDDTTDATDPTETTESTEATEGSSDDWTISHSDVTIKVGESFRLSLKNSAGETADVTWTASPDIKIEGSRITGLTAGSFTVACVHEGESYTCIVRVK